MAASYQQFPSSTPDAGPSLAPPLPDAMRRAGLLILAGAALAVIGGIVVGLTAHDSTFYTYSSTSSGTTVHRSSALASGLIGGVVQALLWLWMAWKTRAGRSWARIVSTVFFGIATLGLIAALFRVGSAPASFVFTVLEWLAGLGAIILLWRAESSQAKYGGYQPPYPGQGYPPQQNGQPGQYGQPAQAQPQQYGEPTQVTHRPDGGYPPPPSDH
jgi:hypothetical protein